MGGSEVMGVWALEYCGTFLSSSWVCSFFLPPPLLILPPLSISLPPFLFLFPSLRYKPCLMETNPTGLPDVEQEPPEGQFFSHIGCGSPGHRELPDIKRPTSKGIGSQGHCRWKTLEGEHKTVREMGCNGKSACSITSTPNRRNISCFFFFKLFIFK